MSEDKTGFAEISTSEEAFVTGACVINSIGLAFAFVFLIALRLQSKQIENKTVLTFALCSMICSCLLFLFLIFCTNDVIIPWNYESGSFLYISDSITDLLYLTNKAFFYFAFTYQIASNVSSKKYLTVCVWIVCTATFCVGMYAIFRDMSAERGDEIGYSSNHNIHVTLWIGREANILAFILFIVDSVYFIILMVVHVRGLRSENTDNNNNDNNGVKLVILLFCSCLIYWVVLFVSGIGSGLRWLLPIDIISDDICVFLMFKGQNQLYRSMCATFDGCCAKCIYNNVKSGDHDAVPNTDDDDDDDKPDDEERNELI